MKIINYYDALPVPTSVDENLLQGKGSVWKLYSATIVDKKGNLQWKLVGWNYKDAEVNHTKSLKLAEKWLNSISDEKFLEEYEDIERRRILGCI